MLQKAAAHKGSAFVEIYQNCKIFNDGVFEYATDKSVKADNVLYLEHGKPMVFGKDKNKGIRLNGLKPEVVEIGKDCQLDDLLTHDEAAEEPTLAYLLSRFAHDTHTDAVKPFPEPVGVLRNIRKPTYEELLDARINDADRQEGEGQDRGPLQGRGRVDGRVDCSRKSVMLEDRREGGAGDSGFRFSAVSPFCIPTLRLDDIRPGT